MCEMKVFSAGARAKSAEEWLHHLSSHFLALSPSLPLASPLSPSLFPSLKDTTILLGTHLGADPLVLAQKSAEKWLHHHATRRQPLPVHATPYVKSQHLPVKLIFTRQTHQKCWELEPFLGFKMCHLYHERRQQQRNGSTTTQLDASPFLSTPGHTSKFQLFRSLSLSLSHSLSHTHTNTQTLFLSLSLTHSRTHTYKHTNTDTHSCPRQVISRNFNIYE